MHYFLKLLCVFLKSINIINSAYCKTTIGAKKNLTFESWKIIIRYSFNKETFEKSYQILTINFIELTILLLLFCVFCAFWLFLQFQVM